MVEARLPFRVNLATALEVGPEEELGGGRYSQGGQQHRSRIPKIMRSQLEQQHWEAAAGTEGKTEVEIGSTGFIRFWDLEGKGEK